MLWVKTYSYNLRYDNNKVISSRTEMSTNVLAKVDIIPFNDSLNKNHIKYYLILKHIQV